MLLVKWIFWPAMPLIEYGVEKINHSYVSQMIEYGVEKNFQSQLRQEIMGLIITAALPLVVKNPNIGSGFGSAAIFSLNPDVFDEVDFLPGRVTDRAWTGEDQSRLGKETLGMSAENEKAKASRSTVSLPKFFNMSAENEKAKASRSTVSLPKFFNTCDRF
ncbi:hypothetical protein QE152_g13070 [Popillia japonica]|uniref:Uncharacterized protein n=1 Tax=Popillia japonica TaxID=7064 RepID=A0AAW1LF59_POPJA